MTVDELKKKRKGLLSNLFGFSRIYNFLTESQERYLVNIYTDLKAVEDELLSRGVKIKRKTTNE
jgi:hypothetical protein